MINFWNHDKNKYVIGIKSDITMNLTTIGVIIYINNELKKKWAYFTALFLKFKVAAAKQVCFFTYNSLVLFFYRKIKNVLDDLSWILTNCVHYLK